MCPLLIFISLSLASSVSFSCLNAFRNVLTALLPNAAFSHFVLYVSRHRAIASLCFGMRLIGIPYIFSISCTTCRLYPICLNFARRLWPINFTRSGLQQYSDGENLQLRCYVVSRTNKINVESNKLIALRTPDTVRKFARLFH
jgi:hypothetical protein